MRRHLAQACWNMRLLALVVCGPALGLAMTAAIFGLPSDLRRLALGMSLFVLALFGVLVRAEYRRLSNDPRP